MSNAQGKVKKVTLSAVVRRNDGTVEDLGVIAKYSRPRPLMWLGLACLCLAIALVLPQLLALASLLGATLLVNGGRAVITNLVGGVGGTVPKYVAWGTGAGTTGATDTTLFTESSETRTSGTVTRTTTSTANDTMQIVGQIVATGARVITNSGLFDAVTVGNLFVKTDFTSITLATGESITFTYSISFA
jgi:hypothetical protein